MLCKLDIIVFILMMSFTLLFSFLGFKSPIFIILGLLVSVFILVGVGQDGVTQVVAYAGGEQIIQEFASFPLSLVPFSLFLFNVFNALRVARR